jgi:glycosyltransferase involved in cell wall biosynthesis
MERMPRRILILSYVFPPYAAVGAYRILKFCKYLREFGFEPSILTPARPNVLARDEGLITQVPPGVPVYRSWSIEPFRVKAENDRKPPSPGENVGPPGRDSGARSLLAPFKDFVKANLSVPDTSLTWSYCGVWAGLKAIRKERADFILSSSPPQSVHLLGERLAAWTGKPLIVDFRDLWTQNTSYLERELPGYLTRRDRRLEQRVLRRAAGITVNTDTFKKQLLENNPTLNDDNIEVVNNGVDPDDFREFAARPSRSDRFTMLYTGSLYGEHRNPEFFLQAIRSWLDRDAGLVDRIRLRFIGNWSAEHIGLIEKYDLDAVIQRDGWLPQRDALAATFAADLLLLFQGFDPVLSAAIPRKLFEYLVTNKPILAFAPPGEIPRVIDRYNAGTCLSNRAPDAIIAVLKENLAAWEAGRGQTEAALLRSMPELETRTQVERLAAFLKRLT